MPRRKPKRVQNVFEVRFEHGYRYLDRCGDAMIILEKALPAISDNKTWMPEDMTPKGARLKCPDLDLTLVFDAGKLCLDQTPTDVQCPFGNIARYAFATIASKFSIGNLTRFGNRQKLILATDSIEDASNLSLKKVPLNDWPVSKIDNMTHRNSDATCVLENADRSKGIRFSTWSSYKIDAPQRIDARLKKAPHLLEKKQKEALIGQLLRAKQRQEDPMAGLEVDIDYWWINPEEAKIEEFFETSSNTIEELVKKFLGE